MKINVEYLDRTHTIHVSTPCKWCKKLMCICDDEYEQYRDRELQAEAKAVDEAMHALKSWDD